MENTDFINKRGTKRRRSYDNDIVRILERITNLEIQIQQLLQFEYFNMSHDRIRQVLAFKEKLKHYKEEL